MALAAGDKITATRMNLATVNGNSVRYVADGVAGGPQSIATSTDTILQFPVSRSTCSAITVSGTNNTTFTVASGFGGSYIITSSLRLASGATGTELAILVDGARMAMGFGTLIAACAVGIELAAGQVIKANAWHTTGSSKSPASGFSDTTHLSIIRIGDS